MISLHKKDRPKHIRVRLAEYRAGVKVEMEHTDDPREAALIAYDHLAEMPDYYTRLRKMERRGNPDTADSLVREKMKLVGKALRAFPGSPKQKAIQAEIARLDTMIPPKEWTKYLERVFPSRKKNPGKLLAVSSSIEGVIKLISKYFYGSTIILKELSPDVYSIFNKNGLIPSYIVRKVKGRFRFEEKE